MPGEHEYRVQDAAGLLHRGWSGGNTARTRLQLDQVLWLEILPVDDDRMTLGALSFCAQAQPGT